jgi:TPR repeat protein/DNA-binding transcriptional regulator GbsR (MarR family)
MTQPINIKPTIDFIYNPDNQSREQLIDGFVVRLKIFKRLFSDIKEGKMESPEQHYLIEGKRGMGKTTLLLRLGYEIENDSSLNSWLIPIVFNEEEYSVRRLYKLWERIASLLEEKNILFKGLHDEMDESYSSFLNEEDYEYAIFNLLNTRLEANGKKLILFIDNFGDIFSKFNKQEIQRLRTVLQTNINFRIFAASATVLEAFYDNKHPFFEFFKVARLQGLDKSEAEELLLKLGETYKQEQIKDIIAHQPGRVESLRRLTGGVIRTIILLFEIFADKKEGSAFSDLEAILDRVTPLYKHRMDDLPAQQQEIVEAIALAWDAISVSEISQKTKIISKTVSAQIQQMEKNEIITKKLTRNKNHLYQISERFFNIWYLMRHGRKGDKRKVLWLVRFLEEWCDEKELLTRTRQNIQSLISGTYHAQGAYYLTEALAAVKGLPYKEQDELIKAARGFLKNKGSEFLQHLSESDLELRERALELLDQGEYQLSLDTLDKMKNKEENMRGVCYCYLKDYNTAEACYLKAIDKEEVHAMHNIAVLYQYELKKFVEAEKYCLMAIDKDHAGAMNNLAILYENEFKDFVKAEKYYLMAIDKEDVEAMYNLAFLYQTEFKDFAKAETYYLIAIDKGHADAMFNLALLYKTEFKDFAKAEKYYLMAINKNHAEAKNNLSHLYYSQQTNKAKALELATEAYNTKALTIMRQTYAQILLWNNQIEASKSIATDFLYEPETFEQYLEGLQEYLLLLLAKSEYQFLYDYFNHPKVVALHGKDQLKPIWYALMYHLQEQYPNEYLRMGDELEETVGEILHKVEQMRKDYV